MAIQWILLCLCVIGLNHKGLLADDDSVVFSENVEIINDSNKMDKNVGTATNAEFIKREGFAPIVYPGKFEIKKILEKQESFSYPSDEQPPKEVENDDGISLDTRMDPNV